MLRFLIMSRLSFDSSRKFCNDKKFEMFPINFIYINKATSNFIEDFNNNINHLENLKKFSIIQLKFTKQ